MLASAPYHALVVHLPVVLIPLTAVGALVVMVKPELLGRFGAVLTALAGIAFVSSIIATQTGEALQERFESSGEAVSKLLEDHGELGEQTRLLALVLVALIGFTWFTSRREYSWVRTWMTQAARALTAIIAIIVAVWTYRTGHTGASSVWSG